MRAALLALALASTALTGCDIREALLPRLVAGQSKYLGPERFTGSEFQQISDRVYAFRWRHYRNISIRTDEGWVVIDPLNAVAADLLAEHLSAVDPAAPVAALIYSHYHLDHAVGGAALKPQRVIAHERSPSYWRDFPSNGVLQPTEFINGDTTFDIGGVTIKAIYLENSHTDTLYAFHLPSDRMLFSVDMGLAKAFLPMGHPDSYGPGVIRALERLVAVDFDAFVPAHFDVGTKADLEEYLEFQKDVRRLAREALDLYGEANGATLSGDSEALKEMFVYVYGPIKEKYGHWHGFDQQSLYIVFSNIVGEVLGF